MDSYHVCISCVLLLSFEDIATKYLYKPQLTFCDPFSRCLGNLVPEDVKIIIMKSSLKPSCHLLLIYISLANDYMPLELMPEGNK